MDKNVRKERVYVIEILLAFLLPAGAVFLIESLAKGGIQEAWVWATSNPAVATVNYLFWFAVLNLLQFCKQRRWCWIWQFVMSVLILGLAVGNMYKLEFRSMPIVLGDVYLVDAALAISKQYFTVSLPAVIAAMVLFVLAVAAALGYSCRKIKGGAYRFVLFGLAVLAAVVAVNSVDSIWTESYSIKNNYEQNGFAVGFLRNTEAELDEIAQPENYSEEAIVEIWKDVSNQPVQEMDIQPNVIVILGEAVMDTNLLPNITLNRDPMPTIHQIMAEYPSGYASVNVQGGGTCLSEAQVLTGLTFGNYTQLSSEQRYLPSLATVFRKQGYHTSALHSYHGWFYDRYEAMKLMGFDEFIPISCFFSPTQAYGAYVQDLFLYQEALERLSTSGERDFLYLATMQTHGSYDYEMENLDWTREELGEVVQNQLNTYLSVLHDADAALGDFLNQLTEFDEPTVVLYFGDHTPSLSETYSALGFDVASTEAFQTPYFIWNNYGLDAEDGDIPLERIGAYLISLLGIADKTHFSIAEEACSEGSSAEAKDAYTMLSYDLLYGKQYSFSLTGDDMKNESYQIGRTMRIWDVFYISIGDSISVQGNGENLTKASKAVVDEKIYDIAILGDGWELELPKGEDVPLPGTSIQIVQMDSRGNDVNKSNVMQIEDGQNIVEKMIRQAEGSLDIMSIYPGTEVPRSRIKPDGSLDLAISTAAISQDTVVVANGVKLATFYAETFISAIVPAEIVFSGMIELCLYNSLIEENSVTTIITIEKQISEEILQREKDSLKVTGVYPEAKVLENRLRPDGSLDLAISTEIISQDTVIVANGVKLATFCADTFISATVPAEIVQVGEVEIYLYNELIGEQSDAIFLCIGQ